MRILTVTAGLVAFILTGVAQAAPACVPDFAAKARAIVDPYVEANAFTGSILVAQDGKPLLRQGFSLANREWDIPNAPDTKFRLGSVTKQFTAAGILLLAQDGKLSIDDPVSKVYPAAPAAWSKVTIKRLLTHTSGIPSYTSLPGFFGKDSRSPLTADEIVGLTKDKPLEFEPGARFAYDNTGYVLLGAIIEKVSGKPYGEFVRERIFTPLGMNDTGYDVSRTVLRHRASGYQSAMDGQLVNTDYLDMTLPHAAGALYSTVDDLLIWDRAIKAGKLLTPASWAATFTDYGHGYGFGWSVKTVEGHRRIGHGGGINGFSTEIDRYPDEDLTVVVLGNSMSAQSGRIATQLRQLCFGEYKAPTKVALTAAELDRYAGRYALAPELAIRVWRREARVFTQVDGQGPVEIFASAPGEFYAGIVDAKISFAPDGSSLTLHQGGKDTKAGRIVGD